MAFKSCPSPPLLPLSLRALVNFEIQSLISFKEHSWACSGAPSISFFIAWISGQLFPPLMGDLFLIPCWDGFVTPRPSSKRFLAPSCKRFWVQTNWGFIHIQLPELCQISQQSNSNSNWKFQFQSWNSSFCPSEIPNLDESLGPLAASPPCLFHPLRLSDLTWADLWVLSQGFCWQNWRVLCNPPRYHYLLSTRCCQLQESSACPALSAIDSPSLLQLPRAHLSLARLTLCCWFDSHLSPWGG